MEMSFEEAIGEFDSSNFSIKITEQIRFYLNNQTDVSILQFLSDSYQSLYILERKIWQIFESNFYQIFDYLQLDFFQTVALFKRQLIFNHNNLEEHMKISLFFPETLGQMNNFFECIQNSNDDNDPFIICATLWLENISYFVHEHPHLGHLPIFIYMNEYIGNHFIMNKNFKNYLEKLQQSQVHSSTFTARYSFYLRTCSLSLHIYFYTNPTSYPYTPNEVLNAIGSDYLKVLHIQSYMIECWSKELLSCIAHLIGFMRALIWWEGEKGTKLRILLPTEKLVCEYIQTLIRILDYKPYYTLITTKWSNEETILFDSILLFLMNIVQTQNMNWFFNSLKQLPDTLLTLTGLSVYFRIHLCTYGILSEILNDENLKELKLTDDRMFLFLHILEQGWQSPTKRYKQIPIIYLLKGFLNLSKNDLVQKHIAKSQKLTLFIEMCDNYSIIYDIIWALSFNEDIQQQLHSNTEFLSRITRLITGCNDQQILKALHGILWNLEREHQDHSNSVNESGKTFDIMISYSHKDKTLCKQIYDELINYGYRVWIDFDQMHGNVMDAMARAIEISNTVIICMSEEYRRSNYCRAEAHYAFQRQRKIVPVLVQKHYKPDGWLLFLIGPLLYINFIKYEFPRAIEMLLEELNAKTLPEIIPESVPITINDKDVVISRLMVSPMLSSVTENILEWTQMQVKDWLMEHNLDQLSRLFAHCDGRTLAHLNRYLNRDQSQQIVSLLEQECVQRIKENLSIIELCRFHSLMDRFKVSFETKSSAQERTSSTNQDKNDDELML